MLAATGITAVFAALALGTTFLAVSVDQDATPLPGAPTTDDWTIVTGNQLLIGGSPDCTMTAEHRNMSDPRLEGDVCINYEGNVGAEELETFWSSITITNVDGSWQGHSVGFTDEREAHHHTGWFEGSGAYEGLAFMSTLTEANPKYPSAGMNLDMVGLVYAGELPPMIDPAWTAE